MVRQGGGVMEEGWYGGWKVEEKLRLLRKIWDGAAAGSIFLCVKAEFNGEKVRLRTIKNDMVAD